MTAETCNTTFDYHLRPSRVIDMTNAYCASSIWGAISLIRAKYLVFFRSMRSATMLQLVGVEDVIWQRIESKRYFQLKIARHKGWSSRSLNRSTLVHHRIDNYLIGTCTSQAKQHRWPYRLIRTNRRSTLVLLLPGWILIRWELFFTDPSELRSES